MNCYMLSNFEISHFEILIKFYLGLKKFFTNIIREDITMHDVAEVAATLALLFITIFFLNLFSLLFL